MTLCELTGKFLLYKDNVTKRALVDLWGEMNEGMFRRNPACPEWIKDHRPGYDTQLIGVSQMQKNTIIRLLIDALTIPEGSEE